ncbi:fatty acid desaturase-domain-containing protein [Gymnopilus junonius]|uniref:Fatty acid desaturase-domain-containing protein n=1 Tax=Gymnopilus junonius TaxID=109634 RepID=A0A9P5NFD1_GYMJU|nr:fatty acid desaturase-domain-containing protein [Gymnopilus junonius]
MLFGNGPEYELRAKTPFIPPTTTLKEIHDAIPKHLLTKNERKSTFYILRDVTFALILYEFAYSITPWADSDFGGYVEQGWQKTLLKALMWIVYWWFQSLVGAGMFCLGHDAGHGSLYENKRLNDIVGFLLHSYLLIPYFSWRSTHHAHHKATGSIERDENYVPYTRSQFKLPNQRMAKKRDYEEIFGETPIYTLGGLLVMQFFGWWLYLSQNAMGSRMYPPGANHFNPYSALFKKEQRHLIFMSDLGIATTFFILYCLGRNFFFSYYVIPYLLVNHWIVMLTFLQHSDPTVPHYRKGAWTFIRGAAATVDRPLLGWLGRFFLHNVGHDHVAHHFFLRAPFYNGPEITKALKNVLKDHYNFDSTPSFYALYRSFNECRFVEDEGDIVFYKNKDGIAVREVHESVAQGVKETEWTIRSEQDRVIEAESDTL